MKNEPKKAELELPEALRRKDWEAGDKAIPVEWYYEVKAFAKRYAERIGRGDVTVTRITHDAIVEWLKDEGDVEMDRHALATMCLLARRMMHQDLRWRGRVKRGGRVRHVPIEQADAAQPDSWIEELGDEIDIEKLRMALDQLAADHPERHEAFVLVRKMRLSYEEAGKCLGVSVKTIGGWLKFAESHLRSRCVSR